ncbi:tyrosine-type recombinase/integrase [Roseibium alexandrii]|uniref:Site-specific recombinase XerD n=1 Tax=Roseibium alexandrii (strain DSM 17067 / NCIMB 14079 / DFL-11) TaxID=244592 RepID=A0A5E8H0T2_ROSAD|nr:site-specific integrase [Roseibium alexandrii]EEE46054.1 Site-specific recombinase XerD [Roseibium alexandrii DFL-11]
MDIPALTESSIKKITVEKPIDINDTGAGRVGILKLRVTPAGKKTWVCRFRSPVEVGKDGKGKNRRLELGEWPALPVKDARKKALAVKAIVDGGDDPTLRKELKGAETIRDLVAWYMTIIDLKPNTLRERERQLDNVILPKVGDIRLSKVNYSVLASVWEPYEVADKKRMASALFATLRHLFNEAHERGRIAENPLLGRKLKIKPVRRKRYLRVNETINEVAAFWHGLDAVPLDQVTKIALRLRLLTGQRTEEIYGMRESEFIADDLWFLSADRTKNGEEHIVPMSPMALDLINEARALAQRKRGDETDLIFPSLTRSIPKRWVPTAVGVMSKAINRNYEAMGLEHFTPHDLRRTLSTHCSRIGCRAEAVERFVNHISGHRAGVAGTYNVGDDHEHIGAMRGVAMAWEAELKRLIAT